MECLQKSRKDKFYIYFKLVDVQLLKIIKITLKPEILVLFVKFFVANSVPERNYFK